MVTVKRKIVWSNTAVKQFNNAIEYIRLDSSQNAEKVKTKILSKIEQLQGSIIENRKDEYRKNNDGHFLYFEVLKYRISYYDKNDEVLIIRIRHTKMEPKKY